ncbi:transposase (fragment) [groundwater metagenome]|uniref:Transposase n=1 Tax=groundwater metagenome TaxID=717931 RepID=A0A098EE96_9ZZZZ
MRIAIDVKTRQVIAFYAGDRTRENAIKLWERIPKKYKQHTIFYTEDWDAYKEVIPKDQHVVCSKDSGKTNIIERFNCTVRQRVSRLVRLSLSFSKKPGLTQKQYNFLVF